MFIEASDMAVSLALGQPSTCMPLAVGHFARSQCSPAVPHQSKLLFSIPSEKYKTTAMKATPASKAAERMCPKILLEPTRPHITDASKNTRSPGHVQGLSAGSKVSLHINNADGEGKNKGHDTCKEKTPPRHLNLSVSDTANVTASNKWNHHEEQTNMGNGGSNSSKSKPISKSKEHTKMNPSLLLIANNIKLKLIIHNSRNVINLSIRSKQVRRKYGELAGTISVESPIRNRSDNVQDQEVSNEDVHDGKERADQRAEKERCDCCPIQCDRAYT
ncbi:hypothetical protein V2J09_002592 [Rumex salicifolius]